MNPEAQRIAIAEACGFSEITREQMPTYSEVRGKQNGKWQWLPDYLNDLNACHEFEKVLTADHQQDFVYYLTEITAPITGEQWMPIHATAAQRCEAFLRTLGLWKDMEEAKEQEEL